VYTLDTILTLAGLIIGVLILYRDILAHVRDWQICASLDGTAATGEYIRTGLDYGAWRVNFEQGLQYASTVDKCA
jgi:hypothetical protein